MEFTLEGTVNRRANGTRMLANVNRAEALWASAGKVETATVGTATAGT